MLPGFTLTGWGVLCNLNVLLLTAVLATVEQRRMYGLTAAVFSGSHVAALPNARFRRLCRRRDITLQHENIKLFGVPVV